MHNWFLFSVIWSSLDSHGRLHSSHAINLRLPAQPHSIPQRLCSYFHTLRTNSWFCVRLLLFYSICLPWQGFCRYLEESFGDLKERGVVIGYDARAHPPSGGSSKRFASLAAAVFISQGVPVHLFSDITPTPFVVMTKTSTFLPLNIAVTYNKILNNKMIIWLLSQFLHNFLLLMCWAFRCKRDQFVWCQVC